MQLPRRKKLKEDLSAMGVLYGLVVAMVVLAFLFSGPLANVMSSGHVGTALNETPGPQNEHQVP